MKCRIKAETGGRIRIHAEISRMSLQEADILEYYLRSITGVRNVKVFDRTCDAIVLYSGGFLGADTALLTPPGAASPGCAVALEAQGLPDPFHLPGASPDILRPGETWRHWIAWHFST